jgi:hypothetical protein
MTPLSNRRAFIKPAMSKETVALLEALMAGRPAERP